MLKIGMVGENPTDIGCISNLLRKKYTEDLTLFPLLNGINGSNLENAKIKHQLRREYQYTKPAFILFIRDLDGLEDNNELLEKRWTYFKEFNTVVDKKGIFLLHIYELEALLLTDIALLNDYYKVNLNPIADCMKVEDPKGFLHRNIKKYFTGDNKALFSLLNYERVIENCRYFDSFSQEFDKNIKN